MGSVCGACFGGIAKPDTKPEKKKAVRIDPSRPEHVESKLPVAVPPPGGKGLETMPADYPGFNGGVIVTSPLEAKVGGPLQIGSFLDIFSNSCEKWCPGVVQGVEGNTVFVAYQTPGESPAVPNINIKTLQADSPEIRLPHEDGPCLGAVVEVLSNSQMWCTGVIQRIEGVLATVAYFELDVAPNSEPSVKVLPLGHQDLMLFGADGAAQALRGTPLEIGCKVDIFSNSMSIWCAGIVENIQDNMATVSFYYPDMDPKKEAPCVKELPLGHQDIRLHVEQHHAVDRSDYMVGTAAEVFSKSRGSWLPGQITQVDSDWVTVSFRYPDVSNTELDTVYTKELMIGSSDLRLVTNNAE